MALYKGSVSLPGYTSKGNTQIENIYKGSTLIHRGGPERVFLWGSGSGVVLNGMYKWNGVAHSASPNGGRKYTKRQLNYSGVEQEAPLIYIAKTASIDPEWRTESMTPNTHYISNFQLTSWVSDGGLLPAPGAAVSYNPNAKVTAFGLAGGNPGDFDGHVFDRNGSNPFEFTSTSDSNFYTFLDTYEDYVADSVVLWDDNNGEPVFACNMDCFPGGPWLSNSYDGELTGITAPITDFVDLD